MISPPWKVKLLTSKVENHPIFHTYKLKIVLRRDGGGTSKARMDGFERALKSPAAPPPVQCLQMEVGLLGRAGGENQISLEKEGGKEREVAGCGSS